MIKRNIMGDVYFFMSANELALYVLVGILAGVCISTIGYLLISSIKNKREYEKGLEGKELKRWLEYRHKI